LEAPVQRVEITDEGSAHPSGLWLMNVRLHFKDGPAKNESVWLVRECGVWKIITDK
jgi:hypothetical protein